MRRTVTVVLSLGILMSGCGTSAKSTTASGQKSASELRASAAANAADLHKAEACIAVIGSFSHLSLKNSNAGVANISRTKEHLHELATYSSPNQQYTIGRLTEVLSRLEEAIEKASAGNYAEANGELTGIREEVKELVPKVVSICGKSASSTSTSGETQSTPAPETTTPEGNVPAAAAALASICTKAAESSETNPPSVEPKVKALVAAYQKDANPQEDRHYLEVAKENLQSGCGARYLPEVEAALGK
jgi:uncharacterized protein YceK